MRAKRRNIQLELALEPEAKGEARSAGPQGTEARAARAEPERPAAGQGPPMEAVVEPGNLKKALARVRRNKGAARHRRHDRRRPGRSPEGPLVRDRVRASRRHLHTAAGAAGGDTEGIGRRSSAWRANGARPLHPAGGDAGVAGGLGPQLFGCELWVPARTLGSSGGGACAGPHPRGLRRRGRSRSGEVLRPGQSRHPDGSGGQAGGRQTPAQADPRLPDRGCAGRRAGRPDHQGDAAGWAAFALAVESDARCPGQGTGGARPSLRPLRRRLQYLRAVPAGGRASGSWRA